MPMALRQASSTQKSLLRRLGGTELKCKRSCSHIIMLVLSFFLVCLFVFFLEKVKRNIIEQVYTCGLYQRCNKTNN